MEKEKEEEEDLEEKSMDSTAEEEEEEEEKKVEERKPTKCSAILKTGDRKGNACGRSVSFRDGRCGLHTQEKKKGEKVESGASDLRKLDVVECGAVYVRNVHGSSKDKADWKDFWKRHTKQEFPRDCRAKDCQKRATCTGHMYLRDEEEARRSKDERKFNYLVPICSHHNSSKYDNEYFLLKKTTVAVKIYERVYFV